MKIVSQSFHYASYLSHFPTSQPFEEGMKRSFFKEKKRWTEIELNTFHPMFSSSNKFLLHKADVLRDILKKNSLWKQTDSWIWCKICLQISFYIDFYLWLNFKSIWYPNKKWAISVSFQIQFRFIFWLILVYHNFLFVVDFFSCMISISDFFFVSRCYLIVENQFKFYYDITQIFILFQ